MVKRRFRSILPFSGSRRVLRFSGRKRSGDEEGLGEAEQSRDEDELHRALGRIAANWSLIEIDSGLVLMGLVGNRDEMLARAVVAGQRVENVWETIQALLTAYGDAGAEQLAAFTVWRRAANKLRRRRNEAIHSAWSLTSDGEGPQAWDVMSQRAKRGARSDLFPGGVAELEELAGAIAASEEQLNQIQDDILVLAEDRSRQIRREGSWA
jgi:hypothetical protein